MEKFFINAIIREKGNILGDDRILTLPVTKTEIERAAKELNHDDIETTTISFETNLPDYITNYIEYYCYITEKDGNHIVNFKENAYTSYEKLKIYNAFALCLDDLYNNDDYDEDYVTRFIEAFAEHSALCIPLENLPLRYLIKDSEREDGFGHLAFLANGAANLLNDNIVFWDYNDLDGDVYTLASWDIDGYEEEYMEDYDDDPAEYLEALTDSYDLYIDEYERYMIDLHHTDYETEVEYANSLQKRLEELGY